ncbi:hypothetical protein U1Q18_013975, partial [Sarracenia purpurea var. burkii]
GSASDEVRRQVERATLADVSDKTGVGFPYATPGRLRPRMRGESRRTKAPLVEKIDLNRLSVLALQHETAIGPPRKFQDVIAPLCPIELLLCLALRLSFSRLDSAGRYEVWLLRYVSSGRPVVQPSRPGLSGRHKARSPRPGSPVWVPVSWFDSSLADSPVRYQGDWSASKVSGSSGLIGGCQILFFDSDLRSVFAFGYHPDL